MPSRRVLAALYVVLVALAAAAALRAAPAHAATTRDDLMKTGLVALQCAIEKSGSARMWAYPHPKSVSPSGGLAIGF
jgi:gas vesicle protein